MSMLFDVRHITAVGSGALASIYDEKPDMKPVFMVDQAGLRMFQAFQNRNGSAFVIGEMVSRMGGTDGTTSAGTITAGTTTQATTSGLTADDHVGSLMYITDNNDSAGAAPEGETSVVVANSATVVDLDPDFPFSAAIANADTADLVGQWNVTDCAAGDLNHVVYGVVMAAVGDNKFGYAQKHGLCPRTLVKAATAITKGVQLIADVARVDAVAAGSKYQVVVGLAEVGCSSDISNDYIIARLACGDFPVGALSDQDAVA